MNEEQFNRIKSLLTKHLFSQLNEQEADELNEWRKSSAQNQELYNRLTSKEYINKRYKDFTEVQLRSKPKTYLNTIFRHKAYRRVAAIIIGVVALLSLYQIVSDIKEKESYSDNPDKLMAVTLRINHTKTINLSSFPVNADIENLCTRIDKNTLKYYPQNTENSSIQEIIIPEVQLFKVILPDGSVVWLNSKSTLTYPSRFNADFRSVSLDGEGYFDIAKDKARPFKVNVNGMSISVTGTQFNVKAYKEDSNVSATLVEGKISIGYENNCGEEKECRLKQGEQSILYKESGEIDIKEVNTSIYTSWKEGIYFFDKQRLEDIMTDLSRWYGLKVVFKDNNAKNRVLSGKLNREETPEELLNSFARLMPGHIRTDGKTVTIY